MIRFAQFPLLAAFPRTANPVGSNGSPHAAFLVAIAIWGEGDNNYSLHPSSAIGEIFQGQIRELVVGKFVRIFVEPIFCPNGDRSSIFFQPFFPALFPS